MLRHSVIAAAYGMLAVAVALVLPRVAPEAGATVGWIAGGLVFVAGALAHEVYARTEEAAAAADRGHLLRAEVGRAREEVNSLRTEMARLDQSLTAVIEGGDEKAKKDLDRVVSEVRVLQSLIERLSAGADGGAGAAKGAAGDRAPTGRVPDGLDETEVLDIVREGLRRDRVDLYLQPVVSLPQRKVRYYECFSRIRDEDGSMMLPDQYIEVAKREGLVGAIDNLLLFRCVQLVRRAQSRNHNVGFFCNISANTLGDHSFFSDFTAFMAENHELARNLIFEFSQADVGAHGGEVEEYLARLGRLGFYFSLDRVDDLTRLDIPALARRRFRFVKINAASLLGANAPAQPARETESAPEPAVAGGEAGAAPAPQRPEADTVVGVNVPALKRAMDVHGIDLIVEKLETEQDLVELLDYQIDFGQGYLFGEPRLSRDG